MNIEAGGKIGLGLRLKCLKKC